MRRKKKDENKLSRNDNNFGYHGENARLKDIWGKKVDEMRKKDPAVLFQPAVIVSIISARLTLTQTRRHIHRYEEMRLLIVVGFTIKTKANKKD